MYLVVTIFLGTQHEKILEQKSISKHLKEFLPKKKLKEFLPKKQLKEFLPKNQLKEVLAQKKLKEFLLMNNLIIRKNKGFFGNNNLQLLSSDKQNDLELH